MKSPESPYKAKEAFDRQSPIFDDIYTGDPVIEYKRKRVRDHVLDQIQAPASILELNSGTGEDALFFAEKGFQVHATDISSGMQNQLIEKLSESDLEGKISTELISYLDLRNLKQKGPYDLIFSNFAGLNCTDQLDRVLSEFKDLLKPGGKLVLVIMPKFCLWEFLTVLKGNFKLAFRRFAHPNGTQAHIEGLFFKCWYYNPGHIIKYLKQDFELKDLEGLCTLVPPSFFESFPYRFSKLYSLLLDWESKLSHSRPWRSIGDYYIISLVKNG